MKYRDEFHKSVEAIRLFPIEQDEENAIACVSIGHVNFRASFYFNSNKDALEAFNVLKKAVDMDID